MRPPSDEERESFRAHVRVTVLRWADDLGRQPDDVLEALEWAFRDSRVMEFQHGAVLGELRRRELLSR